MSSIAIAGSGGSSGRTVLTANRSYFVTTTGSDSNGGTNSSTDAWATLQHAINIVQGTIDFAGFTVTINLGAGTFNGANLSGSTGGGILQVEGAGSASTTLINVDGTNATDVFDIIGLCTASIGINKVKFAGVSASFCGGLGIFATGVTITLGEAATNSGADVNFKPIAAPWLFTTNPSLLNISPGTAVLDGSALAGSITTAFISGEAIVQNFANWTFANTPAFGTDGFVNVSETGVFVDFTNSYTGASTGLAAVITSNSAVNAVLSAVGTAGVVTTDAGSVYSNNSSGFAVPGANVNYQQPATGFSITLGNPDTQVILDPAGALATGTITMQPAPIDGHLVMIRSSQTITALTVNGNTGQTVLAVPTTLAAGTVAIAIFKISNKTWYF